MFHAATHPKSILGVFSDSFKFYKTIIIKSLPWTLPIAFFQILSRAFMPAVDAFQPDTPIPWHISLITVFSNVLMFIFLTCLIYQLLHLVDNKKTSYGETLAKGFTRGVIALVSYMAYIVLFAVIVFGLYSLLKHVPMFGPIVTYFLVMIALTYLTVCIFAWIPVMMLGMNPIAGLKRSFSLVKNHWWATLGLLLLAGIVVLAISALINLLTGSTISSASDTSPSLHIGQYIALFLNSVLIFPWLISVVVLQIRNLGLIKNVHDLAKSH